MKIDTAQHLVTATTNDIARRNPTTAFVVHLQKGVGENINLQHAALPFDALGMFGRAHVVGFANSAPTQTFLSSLSESPAWLERANLTVQEDTGEKVSEFALKSTEPKTYSAGQVTLRAEIKPPCLVIHVPKTSPSEMLSSQKAMPEEQNLQRPLTHHAKRTSNLACDTTKKPKVTLLVTDSDATLVIGTPRLDDEAEAKLRAKILALQTELGTSLKSVIINGNKHKKIQFNHQEIKYGPR
jgi:hypothetical protein